MSDTPRTDAVCRTVDHTTLVGGKIYQATIETVDASFARQLERELAEARAEINIIEHDANVLIGDIKAGLERKNKLAEQMREALIVADSLVTSLIDTHVDRCASVYDFDRNIIKAALSAAERGE